MRIPWYVPLALVCALAVAIWVAALGWRRADIEADKAKRIAESSALEKAGIQQAHAAEKRDLAASVNLAQRRLGEALASAGIKSTTIVTVSGSTGPVQAGGSGLTPQSPGAVHAPGPVAPSPGAGERACLLREGEAGEIRVSGAAARTAAGNVAIDGQADAYGIPLPPDWRDAHRWDLSPRHLFGGPLTLEAKYLSPQVPGSRSAGWGLGAQVVLTRDGWSAGPAIGAPPLRFLWLTWEPQAAFTLGRGGQWAASGSILVRSR